MSEISRQNRSMQAQFFRGVQDKNPYAALGRATSYLMTKPAFANLQFGHWARTLTGQINRKHYFFIVNGDATQGFLGWALVNEEHARLWANGKADIGHALSVDGDCIVVNAWAADNDAVMKFSIEEARRRIPRDKKKIFFKRFYSDGRIRMSCLDAEKFIEKANRNEEYSKGAA